MKKIFILVLTVCCCGCTSIPPQFAPSKQGQAYEPRTPPEKIEMFRSQQPARKYIEVGTTSTCCYQDVASAVDELRKSSAVHGGDALIGLEVDPTGHVLATIIRYTDTP